MVEVGWLSHPPHYYHFLHVIIDEIPSYVIVCGCVCVCVCGCVVTTSEQSIYHWWLMQYLGRMYTLAEMAFQVL